jgi:hypothetical protein
MGKVYKGIKLWPESDWSYPISVTTIMLTLPDGNSYYPKVKGFELWHEGQADPPYIVIEEIPEINNEVPRGSRIYMRNEIIERWKRYDFRCEHGFSF